MNNSIFIISFLSLILLSSPSLIFAQTDVGIETEVGVEIGIESGSESSAEVKSSTKGEVKSESKSESDTKAQDTQKSESESETKTSVGNIAVSTKGNISASVGLPTKYPMPSVISKNSIMLQTDQHLYKPGERIEIQGSLWSELLANLSNDNVVTVKIFDKTKNIVYETDTQITTDGKYSAQFDLPHNLPKGSYTVTSSINFESGVGDLIGLKGQTTVGASAKIAIVPAQVFKINVENHGDFDVKIASNSTVNDIKFNGDQKKVSVIVEGESGTKGVTHISIPKSMVSGTFKVMIDGKAVANNQVIVTSSSEIETELEVNYSHSVHTIDVIGTQAVPEFGTIVMMILIVSIVSVIVISARSKLTIMPRV